MPTYYIWIDRDVGGTPTNDTPDTSTSKYHTTDAMPASTARWLNFQTALTDATISALTGDLVVYCRGGSNGAQPWANITSLGAASLTVRGDCTYPNGLWNDTDFVFGATSAYCWYVGDINCPVVIENVQFQTAGTGTANGMLHVRATTASAPNFTLTVRNCWFKLNASGYTNGAACVDENQNRTCVFTNCVFEEVAGSSFQNKGVAGAGASTKLQVINSIVAHFNSTNDIGVLNCDKVINTALVDCYSQYAGTINTSLNNATTNGWGTNGLTVSNWSSQFNDVNNSDYRLKSGVSMLTSGVGPGSNSDVPTVDINNNVRSGTTTSIGPYNYYAPVTPFLNMKTTG